jgi:hypothetical protein
MEDKNLVQKLAKATADVGGKLKADKRNEEQKYNYVSADKILSACGQALAENGVMVIPSIVKQEITMLEYTNSYGKQGKRYDAVVDLLLKVTDGVTSFEEPWFGMGSDYSVPDKALYKAITSGHKYFISKLFCIGEGNEDSEHEQAEQEQPAPKQATKPQPAQPAAPVPTNGNGHEPEAPAPAMTLEDAMNVTNSEGELYGSLPTEKLAIMSNSLRKVLKGEAMSAEDRAERIRKHTAIGIILAHREAQKN